MRPRRPLPHARLLLAGLALATLAACPASEPPLPVDDLEPEAARPDLVEELLLDLRSPRHVSDGGGRAWIEEDGESPRAIRCGTAGSWRFVYEAGEHGIRRGGGLYFQVSPFWGWSSPQITRPDHLGFTTVACDAEGVELIARPAGQQLLHVEVAGADLPPGARVRIHYGAGAQGALCDRNAERVSHFWFAVDGDGDGVRGVLVDSPSIEVLPHEPARLILTAPSTLEPGAEARLRVAVVDPLANACREASARIELAVEGRAIEDLGLPREVVLDGLPFATLRFRVPDEGVVRLHARTDLDGREVLARCNPVLVEQGVEPLFWGDLHGHSELSDGTGTPEDYYAYARDVAGLDLVALTDHDHFGMLALDQHPDLWARIRAAAREAHEDGRFLALFGYEWTSWIHGHRHVVYFGDEGEIHSSLDEDCDTPPELWARLRGQPAVTIPHHPGGGPIAVNWTFAPDPVLEPVVEVASAHGSSEHAGSESRIYSWRDSGSVRRALERGYHLGWIASGDGHDGHPGATHLGPVYGYRPARGRRPEELGRGGLAALRADRLDRESCLAALRARRVYATSGPRILLSTALGGARGGEVLDAGEVGAGERLTVRVIAETPLRYVRLIYSGEDLHEARPAGGDPRELRASWELPRPRPGDTLYVRALQEDGGTAWSSPIYFD